MTIIRLKEILKLKRGYLKKSPKVVAKAFGTTIEEARTAMQSVKRLQINSREAKIKRLFFDIETSPMTVFTWRIGYNINLNYENIISDWKIICICYKWEGDDTVHYLTWDKNQNDKQMLEEFIKIANKADELVAHNGDKFDLPKIRTRCIQLRIPMFPNYSTLDTLKKARSSFKFNSNRLDYIARILNVGEKITTEYDLWKQCMNNDPEALKRMVNYCQRDVIILEDVFQVMKNYMKHNTHEGVVIGNNSFSCPSCGEEEKLMLHKNDVTAAGTIRRRMECLCCNNKFTISNANYKKYINYQKK